MMIDLEALQLMRTYDGDLTAASVAVFLAVAGQEGLTVGEVEERAGLPRHSGRRALRQLVEREHRGSQVPALVQLLAHESDRRYRRVFLTTRGELLAREITAGVNARLTGPPALV